LQCGSPPGLHAWSTASLTTTYCYLVDQGNCAYTVGHILKYLRLML